jgi:hypothetical protein
MFGTRIRFGVIAATAVAALALTGCTSPAAPAPNSSAPAVQGEGAPAGEIDCTAVGDTLIAWIEASFAGISTEITNGEVAAQYTVAANAHAAASVPGAAEWEVLGDVIDEYVSQWSALPADEGAFENVETVEAHVDSFAKSRGFDNDNFDDMTPIVGEDCAAELEGLLEG